MSHSSVNPNPRHPSTNTQQPENGIQKSSKQLTNNIHSCTFQSHSNIPFAPQPLTCNDQRSTLTDILFTKTNTKIIEMFDNESSTESNFSVSDANSNSNDKKIEKEILRKCDLIIDQSLTHSLSVPEISQKLNEKSDDQQRMESRVHSSPYLPSIECTKDLKYKMSISEEGLLTFRSDNVKKCMKKKRKEGQLQKKSRKRMCNKLKRKCRFSPSPNFCPRKSNFGKRNKCSFVGRLPKTCSPPTNHKPSINPGIICEKRFKTGWNCISINAHQSLVALGGWKQIQFMKIDQYSGQFNPIKASKYEKEKPKFGAIDTKFHPSLPNIFLSATVSGLLTLWDLNKNCTHNAMKNKLNLDRTINSNDILAWIPDTQNILVGSSDGHCYIWDTRVPGKQFHNHSSCALPPKNNEQKKRKITNLKNVPSFYPSILNSRRTDFDIKNVKVSCFNPNVFATAHQSGYISIWDTRNMKQRFISLLAHDGVTASIDWHPALPNILASGGWRDNRIKVWNLSLDEQHMNIYNHYDGVFDGRVQSQLECECILRPAQAPKQILWRPCTNYRSLSANQIACSYGLENIIDVWDFSSAFMPVACLASHAGQVQFQFLLRNMPFRSPNDDGISDNVIVGDDDGMNYDERCESNLQYSYLLSCCTDHSVKLTDCTFANISRRNLSSCALDIAPFGNISFVGNERQRLHPFGPQTYLNRTDIQWKEDKFSEVMPKPLRLRNSSKSENTWRKCVNTNESESHSLVSSPPIKSTSSSSSTFGSLFSWNKKKNIETKNISLVKKDEFFVNLDKNRNKLYFNNNIVYNHTNGNSMARMDCSQVNELTRVLSEGPIPKRNTFSKFKTNLTSINIQSNDVQFHCLPFENYNTFIYFAMEYKYFSKEMSIAQVFEHNSEIVKYADICLELQHLWKLLAILSRSVSSNKADKVRDKPNDHSLIIDIEDSPQSSSLLSSKQSSSSSFDDEYFYDTTDDECSSSAPSSLDLLENAMQCLQPMQRSQMYSLEFVANYIKDVLMENIARGDIQTAATIILILDKYIHQYLDKETIADIIVCYFDLLLKYELFLEAMEIYDRMEKYPFVIRVLNSMMSDRLIMSCIGCKIVSTCERCPECRRPSVCSQCRRPIMSVMDGVHSRVLIWCQVCGHGGHFDHIKLWMGSGKGRRNSCSVDCCSHECQYVLVLLGE